jgi:hypothetical protein
MPFGRSAIQSNVIALFMLHQRRQKTRFIPLCDMRLEAAVRSEFFCNIVMAAVSPEAHHVPFPAA